MRIDGAAPAQEAVGGAGRGGGDGRPRGGRRVRGTGGDRGVAGQQGAYAEAADREDARDGGGGQGDARPAPGGPVPPAGRGPGHAALHPGQHPLPVRLVRLGGVAERSLQLVH
ncbi:hypothetical protein CP974_00745 [Streptomyces fradiae ATCC 10745 = DSM 40063]|nr:hypothetical protein CP974_00745 [Streptomyces fradiae ATCC 10745 = DSM 40063]